MKRGSEIQSLSDKHNVNICVVHFAERQLLTSESCHQLLKFLMGVLALNLTHTDRYLLVLFSWNAFWILFVSLSGYSFFKVLIWQRVFI